VLLCTDPFIENRSDNRKVRESFLKMAHQVEQDHLQGDDYKESRESHWRPLANKVALQFQDKDGRKISDLRLSDNATSYINARYDEAKNTNQ
jgi:hypothetical protein